MREAQVEIRESGSDSGSCGRKRSYPVCMRVNQKQLKC